MSNFGTIKENADSFASFAGRSGEPGERKRTGRTNLVIDPT
jgi:hypothetical protein